MGHLINPIGFRVGHTRGWIDNWFAYNDFYPEFLHFVLKIRFFFNSVLSSLPGGDDLDRIKSQMSISDPNFLDLDSNYLFKFNILYSHYQIVFNFSTIFIALYYYPGTFFEKCFEATQRRFSKSRIMFNTLLMQKRIL